MDPVFEIQMKSLRSYCSGKKDRLCSAGKFCKRTDCNRAHTKDECIDGFYDAMRAVDQVMNEEVMRYKHHSRILASLNKTLQRKNVHRRQNNKRYQQNNNENDANNWRRN